MKQSTKKAFNVAMATTMAAGAVVAVAPTQASAAVSFSDVKETNTHYANILNLAERGVISGYEDGTFRPGDSIKRGNAAKIIAGVLGLDTTNVKNPGFKDVSVNNSNYGAIAALAGLGIINGFEDNTYRANDTLTRGQMSKIIANAFKLTATNTDIPFTDVQNSQYKENIAALFTNGVTTGTTATTFDARSAVTRGQLASFVVRAEEAAKKETPVEPTPEPGEEKPTEPTLPPTTGGNTGGGSVNYTLADLNVTVDNVLDSVFDKVNTEDVGYATVELEEDTITFTVKDGETPVSTIRNELKQESNGLVLTDLVTMIGADNALKIAGNVTSIEVTAAGVAPLNLTTTDFLAGLGGTAADLNLEKENVLKGKLNTFIEAVLGKDGLKIADVQQKYATDKVTLTVNSNLGQVTYKVEIK